MKFHTFGDKTKKPVMLIHGMLNPWQIWETAIEALSGDYYVIVPELDAHTEEETTSFRSVESEAAEILDFLLTVTGGHLYLLCGLSMGGRIAATLAGFPAIHVENLVLDGAPLLKVSKLLVGIMKKSYIGIIRKSRARDPKVLESAKRDFLPEKYIPYYLKIADHMEEESVKNILNSVFSAFTYKKYSDDCRILFMHGTKGNESVSKKAALKMKSVNPQTEIMCFDGYAHAYLASFEPEKWVETVKDWAVKQKKTGD